MRKRINLFLMLLAPVALGAFFFLATLPPALTAAGEESVSCSSLSERRIPRGVSVNGVPVGGLKKGEAVSALMAAEKQSVPVLCVKTPKGEYRYSYPEIDFLIDFSPTLEQAERGKSYTTVPVYFLKGLEEKAERICADNRLSPLDACIRFSEDGFSFDGERSGVECDKEKLKMDIARALTLPKERGEHGEGKFPTVELSCRQKNPKISLFEAKRNAEEIGAFTTWFSTEDTGRCSNIALAAKKLDGLTVRAGQEFSFNAAVGARTKKRGFKEAKIIQDGEFVTGTGGGVCQVSTTLFNAALLSGLRVTARSPHSLAVAYIAPSRDAMVSSASDLKFKNPFSYPVYLSVKTGEGYLTVRFFGRKTGYEYKLESVITGETDPPEPLVKYGETEGEIRKERKGVKSESYLVTYFSGKFVRRERLYADAYAPTRGIVGKKIDNTAKKTSSNVCLFREKMV